MIENILEIWKYLAKKYSNKIALASENQKIEISYSNLYKYICSCGALLQKLGLEREDKVCLFAENSPEWVIADVGIMIAGGICVPRQTENFSELSYIYQNSDASVLISDKIETINKILENFPKTKFAIYIGNQDIILNEKDSDKIIKYNLFEKLPDSMTLSKPDISPLDTALIIYTSGTSGEPKGVLFTHKNLAFIIQHYIPKNIMFNSGINICTLPLWHTGIRSFTYHSLYNGVKIIFTEYSNYTKTLRKYKSNLFIFVPKLMILVYNEFQNIISQKNVLYQKLFKYFYKFSTLRYSTEKNLLIPIIMDFLGYIFIYKQLKNFLMNEKSLIEVTGAMIDEKSELFFKVLRTNLFNFFGSTEANTGISIYYNCNKVSAGSIGKCFPYIMLKLISVDTEEEITTPNTVGRIFIKSEYQTTGYYNNAEATAKLITEDGYLETGDMGYLDSDKNLFITGRYKDMIVLNNGENIEPASIENLCRQSKYIKQIIYIGHGKPYLSAIVLPDYQNCDKNMAEAQLKEFLTDEINKIAVSREHFKWIERVRNVLLINEDFSVENECLTKSLKIRRFKICEKYADEIEKLYNEPPLI